MDYTMDTLSLEGDHPCGGKYEMSPSGRSVETNRHFAPSGDEGVDSTGEHFIPSDTKRSSQADDRQMPAVYDIEQSRNKSGDNGYEEERSIMAGGGDSGAHRQPMARQGYLYQEDERELPESMEIEHQEAVKRLSTYYPNDMRPVGIKDVEDRSKGKKPIDTNYSPVVSDFLPLTGDSSYAQSHEDQQGFGNVDRSGSQSQQGVSMRYMDHSNPQEMDASFPYMETPKGEDSQQSERSEYPQRSNTGDIHGSSERMELSASLHERDVSKNEFNVQHGDSANISLGSSFNEFSESSTVSRERSDETKGNPGPNLSKDFSSSAHDDTSDTGQNSTFDHQDVSSPSPTGESVSGKRRRKVSLSESEDEVKPSMGELDEYSQGHENGASESSEDTDNLSDDENETADNQLGKNVSEGEGKDEDVQSVQSIESPPSPPIGGRRKYRCKECNKTFKLRKDLTRHVKTHAASRKYSCSVCNSGFPTKPLLKRHMSTHTDNRSYSCQECSTICNSVAELREHKRSHPHVRAFSCTTCTYSAKRQKDLTKHMLVHTADKIHNCQFCKFSSKRKYSLQRHMKTAHSTAQIFECTVCNFKTSAIDSFKVHVAMHASTRTITCIICGAVIKKRTNLIEHLLGHSTDPESSCKECEETFSTSYEYILHLLSHKDLSMGSEDQIQPSIFDLNPPFFPNGSADFSGSYGFLGKKSKMVMDTPTMEAKIVQMSSVAARLADMTKVVTLLNEKNKVVLQLGEISTLATELAVISGNVLQSYKNTYSIAGGAKANSASNDTEDESTFMDDDFGLSSVLTLTAATIKQELQDTFPNAEAGMQIQVDFNGDPISCIQKDEPYRPRGPRSKYGGGMKCSRCNLMFTDTRSLKRHMMAHDDVRPYSCEKCGQSFRRNEHLKKHMVTHSDERPFTCKDCPYAAKTEHRLKIHMLCHSQTKSYSCQHCTYTARTNYELNHHMKRHEPRTCSQCNFVCYSRPELRKHVFTHSSFDCSECEFTTNDRSEYTKHTKKHSLVQHLCCELCGYSCDTMKKFKYHKLRHENKTPYQCQDCDYKCSSRASFDCHRLKHAGLKPYLCSFCGAAFRKTSHLNQHLLIHKDEKAFKCSECGYACRTKHNLKEHEMTHSGEKPFACKFCSFSCRRNKILQLHMLKHESHSMLMPQMQMPLMHMPPLQLPPPMLHTPMMSPPCL